MKKWFTIFVFSGVLALSEPVAMAQCPMCKASIESTHNSKSSPLAKGLNFGILYMFILPYCSLMILGIALYRIKVRGKKEEKIEESEENN